jgi:hypothetical protein
MISLGDFIKWTNKTLKESDGVVFALIRLNTTQTKNKNDNLQNSNLIFPDLSSQAYFLNDENKPDKFSLNYSLSNIFSNKEQEQSLLKLNSHKHESVILNAIKLLGQKNLLSNSTRTGPYAYLPG